MKIEDIPNKTIIDEFVRRGFCGDSDLTVEPIENLVNEMFHRVRNGVFVFTPEPVSKGMMPHSLVMHSGSPAEILGLIAFANEAAHRDVHMRLGRPDDDDA